jgi:DNA-binding NarL/FixJ family response regulator
MNSTNPAESDARQSPWRTVGHGYTPCHLPISLTTVVMRITLKHVIERVPAFTFAGGESPDGQVIEAIHAAKPKVVLVDDASDGSPRVNLMKRIRVAAPDCRIVMISREASPTSALTGFEAGATAYVLKKEIAGNLLAAINAVLREEHYVSESVAQEMDAVLKSE